MSRMIGRWRIICSIHKRECLQLPGTYVGWKIYPGTPFFHCSPDMRPLIKTHTGTSILRQHFSEVAILPSEIVFLCRYLWIPVPPDWVHRTRENSPCQTFRRRRTSFSILLKLMSAQIRGYGRRTCQEVQDRHRQGRASRNEQLRENRTREPWTQLR